MKKPLPTMIYSALTVGLINTDNDSNFCNVSKQFCLYYNTWGSTAPLMVCVYMHLISRHLIQFMAAVILHLV
jgi:hypothetical protein